MGWIRQQKNKHVCQRPKLDDLIQPFPGDVWECDHCSKQWVVLEHQIDGLYWMEFLT